MSRYNITVRAIGEDNLADSELTVLVDIEGGRPHIVELTIRAPEGSSLATGSIPQIDFAVLAKALIPAAHEAADGATAPATSADVPAAQPKAAKSRGTATQKQAGAAKRPAKASASPHVRGARAYRRAPDLAELSALYAETGSIAGVAKALDVPIHTAQGWISRMRAKS